MKHLFLTSQVQHVAHSIGSKISDDIKKKSVFIITPVKGKPNSDLNWHRKNLERMQDNGFHFDMYDIADKTETDIVKDLSGYLCMYVEGGSSPYMLQEAQKNNFGNYVKERVEAGMIYISTSAGSIIAGPQLPPYARDDRFVQPPLSSYIGFNLVNFTVIPHWGSQEFGRKYLGGRIESIYSEQMPPFIFLADHQYVEVKDDWCQIVDLPAGRQA